MVPSQDYPSEFLLFLASVTGKRARIVIDHILEHGSITTEELKDRYGYSHPPRAARDVREAGVPLVTFKTQGRDGRTIAAYRFGDPSEIDRTRAGGRRSIPRTIKATLIEQTGAQCAVCRGRYDPVHLQVDHRVPYEVGGDAAAPATPDDFMRLCGSCNRAKSWACEHCDNWHSVKSAQHCQVCYWGSPAAYEHIGLKPLRRIDLVWQEGEIDDFEALQRLTLQHDEVLHIYIKAVLARHLNDR